MRVLPDAAPVASGQEVTFTYVLTNKTGGTIFYGAQFAPGWVTGFRDSSGEMPCDPFVDGVAPGFYMWTNGETVGCMRTTTLPE
jgi:hypothetical protein